LEQEVKIESMQLKSATHQDLKRIAECHASAFPESLSTAMGQEYLQKMLSWYLSTDKTFLFILTDQSKVIGYFGGMIVDPRQRMGSASSMAQHSFNAAVKAFLTKPWLLFHKEVISKYGFILKNLSKRITRIRGKNVVYITSSGSASASDQYAALVVIGVRKNFQGGGCGSKLLSEFEKQSQSRGLLNMLLTVRTDNMQAIKAYERNGWVKTESNPKSTTMRKYIAP
jgi:ribosomal protein S18 acetylase RimI-like enzyme